MGQSDSACLRRDLSEHVGCKKAGRCDTVLVFKCSPSASSVESRRCALIVRRSTDVASRCDECPSHAALHREVRGLQALGGLQS